MIIVTGANKDSAKDDSGNLHKNFSFRGVIEKTAQQAKLCGYTPVIYDLGSLGIGKPFNVNDESFASNGYYEKEVVKGYKSKSLFKPEMISMCMAEYNDFTVYVDGDAQLCGNIDEVVCDDYDIGVTLRDPVELENEWHKEHFDIVKYVNAGVIFFNATDAAKRFIEAWHKETEAIGNDQMALNKLTCPDHYPDYFSVSTINGIRIKYFPGKQYNYYYFEDGLVPNIKIMHFKGPVRHYYPFDWRKKLYCHTMIPIKNNIRKIIKLILPKNS